MRIEHLHSVDSTNEYIKRYIPNRENVAVSADMQTGGRGTKGRSFLSDMGGVFLSFLTFPADMVAAKSFRIMAHAAVSVCKTLEEYGILPEIKWPNDVRAAGRKIAGILIENGLKGDRVDHSIVGVGLNVQNDVSSLGGIAVSMRELVAPPPAEAVRQKLIENFLAPSDFGEYRARARFLGRTIGVEEGGRRFTAVARAILDDGRLVVEREGEICTLSAAEIFLDRGEQ